MVKKRIVYMLCHCSQETSSSDWEDLEKKNLVILTPHYRRTFTFNWSVEHAKNRDILNFTKVSLFVYRTESKTKHTSMQINLNLWKRRSFEAVWSFSYKWNPALCTSLTWSFIWPDGYSKNWLMSWQNLSQWFFNGLGNLISVNWKLVGRCPSFQEDQEEWCW